jgi:hypothetical protein
VEACFGFATDATVYLNSTISMAYRPLQKRHRSFVSRQTVFK